MNDPIVKHISGFSNPTVKYLRGLRDKKHRRLAGKFMAEGLRLLTDALISGYVPEMVVMADGREQHPLLTNILDAVERNGGQIITTSYDILGKITGKDNPQSVIGLFKDISMSLDHIDRQQAPIWLVVQDMRDPGNLGTMMRTADAIGAGGLILIDDCTDPFSFETVRASMGAVFTQHIVQCRWPEFKDWLRGGPGQLIAASLRDARNYRTASYCAPCFIMIGNESKGLPEEYELECDLRVTMPMRGRADSLNAAIAGAVLGYEVLEHIGA